MSHIIQNELRYADTELYDAMNDGVVILSVDRREIIYFNPGFNTFDSISEKNYVEKLIVEYCFEGISESRFLELTDYSKVKIKNVSFGTEGDHLLLVLIRNHNKPFSRHYEVLNESEERIKVGTWQYLATEDKLSISEGFARILGIPAGAGGYPSTLKEYLKFVVPEDKKKIFALAESIIESGENYDDIIHSILVNGQVKVILVSTLKVSKSHDGINSLQGVIQDITKEKNEEAMKLKSINELNKSNAALSEFAYTASHDLQEPLRKIEAYASRLENILGDELPEKASGYLKSLKGAAVRMSELIDDILKLSRLNANKPEFEDIDLKTLMATIVEDFEVVIKNTNASIFIDLPVISGIKVQIKQLFQNMLGNALKFRKENVNPEINLKLEQAETTELEELGLEKYKKYYKIIISDNGIGFDQQFADKIFAPFKRLTGRSEHPGNGIGLAICKKVVENHDGMISVKSQEGIGTTFLIYLPQNK